jgi:hypothetical protein
VKETLGKVTTVSTKPLDAKKQEEALQLIWNTQYTPPEKQVLYEEYVDEDALALEELKAIAKKYGLG